MSGRAHRIGAVFYLLWGIIHVLGGAAMLATLRSAGGAGVLRMIATADPGSAPDSVPEIVTAVAGFHSWNLLWIGALVAGVALTLNWRNRRSGFWINLTLAGAADAGLVAFMLAPGLMRLSDGLIGIVLFGLAFMFSGLGRRYATDMRS
ncbi:MAG: hypothetical protein Q8W46_07445 [Candidatus Palauibacterales bacterium]|nr:hypothetical protein [Candidatus Palauibacterales bacterium]